MSLQGKLQELKDMYDKGLITATIYEEQQKNLLASQLSSAPTVEPPTSAAASPTQRKSELLDPKKNLSVLKRLIIIFLVVLAGMWLVFNLSGKEGKSAVSQFSAETGIGKQIIPWPDRAETVANSLVQTNQQNIANAVQGIAHPTGKNPSLESYHVSKLNHSIIVEFRVSWQGGILGGNYTTVVDWEISESNSAQAKITQDTAPVPVKLQNAEQLNNYFYTKVYPAFVQGIGS